MTNNSIRLLSLLLLDKGLLHKSQKTPGPNRLLLSSASWLMFMCTVHGYMVRSLGSAYDNCSVGVSVGKNTQKFLNKKRAKLSIMSIIYLGM